MDIVFDKATKLDADDPLGPMRSKFHLPERMIYLDGNSLGAQPKCVASRMEKAIDVEWREHLITGWNVDGWVDYPVRLGERIAPLIGAPEYTVRVCDSTTVNVFKVLSAALDRQGNGGFVLSDTGNFPTDLYVAQNICARSDAVLKLVEDEEVEDEIDETVSVVMLTEVDYRTGRRHDMKKITRKAHDCGALVIWDLAHSAGAFRVELDICQADFAVGCGYKYFNGGPGAPAFVFVRADHQEKIQPVMAGWFGHKAPFAFDPHFEVARGIDRMRVGTPPVLSMIALDAALDLWDDVDLHAVERKSLALTSYFIKCVGSYADAYDLRLATPLDAAKRGSHVSWRHEQAYPIMQALISRGVVGDMRAPDYLRFGFAPLYNSFDDAAQAARHLHDILETRAWDKPEFHTRKAVT